MCHPKRVSLKDYILFQTVIENLRIIETLLCHINTFRDYVKIMLESCSCMLINILEILKSKMMSKTG